jgi:hypothetical protein
MTVDVLVLSMAVLLQHCCFGKQLIVLDGMLSVEYLSIGIVSSVGHLQQLRYVAMNLHG